MTRDFRSSAKNLNTAGVSYIIQLCAIGGSNGQSDWTETGPNMSL